MTNELDIQKELVDAAIEDHDGHAFKCNNRFLKGVVDLSIQLPAFEHTYIEVKFEKKFSKRLKRPDLSMAQLKAAGLWDQPQVKIELTPHQRTFIRDHRAAHGCAGWVMVVARGRGAYSMVCSTGLPSHGVLYYGDDWLEKPRGGKWPIREIVKRLQRVRLMSDDA